MFIDVTKNNRSSLTKEQQDFLERIVPWSRFNQEQTKIKSKVFKKIDGVGMLGSIFAADCIIQSNWGKHPLSQMVYKHRKANNLTMMEVDPFWNRVDENNKPAKVKFEGKEYKLFEDWEEFTIHYSDYIVFSGKFTDLLCVGSVNEQALSMGLYRDSSEVYTSRMISIIKLYDLEEFNYGFGT